MDSADTTYANLVNVIASFDVAAARGKKRVVPGDPANSFMMHKLDGDQCTMATDCATGMTMYTDCGQQMPYSSPALDDATRDTIRRWISQGAQNN